MASSSSQQSQKEPAYESDRLKVTILASEWGSSKGGLSAINRELAIQLAKCPEAEITLFLPQCSEEDKNIALNHNINIVEATRRPGYEELDWLTFPPEELKVDVIVGHGVKLGRQAQIIRNSHKCRWVQVVHTDPEELGMFKLYPNPISKGEGKHNVEVELCQMADFVVGIGPKLTEAFRAYLRWCGKDESIHCFTPGIFDEFQNVQQVFNDGENCGILVFGRGDAEDFALKGFDIAGKAVASLPNTHLVFVGAPDGKHEEIAARFLECSVPRNRLKVRGYVNSRESLKRLFCEVDIVLMPSRTEGFGLTGLEALSAGLPVLVSHNSGFGQALRKVFFGSMVVIGSEEPQVWAAAIKQRWDIDRRTRLQEAEHLRTCYGKKYSWAEQSKDLLQKMVNLTHAIPSSSSFGSGYDLEVYRADVQLEREARKKQHEEILRLREQIHQLQQENQHYQDEIKRFSSMAEMQQRHDSFFPEQQDPEQPRGWFDTSPGLFPRGGSEMSEVPRNPEGHMHGGQQISGREQMGSGLQVHQTGGVAVEGWEDPTYRRAFVNFDNLQVHAVECSGAQPPPDHQCPKCMEVFPDYDTLAIHVEECLE